MEKSVLSTIPQHTLAEIDPNLRNPVLQSFTGKTVERFALGYARVSTKLQVQDGFSLDHQDKVIKEYCEKNNIKLRGMYVDAGISGKDFRIRPQFIKLLANCQPHD